MGMCSLGRGLCHRLRYFYHFVKYGRRELHDLKYLMAKILIGQMHDRGIYRSLHDAEFKIHSQWGDDGIIQYLAMQTGIDRSLKKFVEFGVGDYMESNTRYLLIQHNWSGLAVDQNSFLIEVIKHDPLFWRHDLRVACAFIHQENVNEIITQHKLNGDIGLLSIDLDGNDYWVWKSITAARPVIVVCEYNSLFGSERALTVPYDPQFRRSQAHPSSLYYGCSLRALCRLAGEKGYEFVGCNSNGNNAYFIRRDRMGKIPVGRIEDEFVRAKFREMRDARGRKMYESADHGLMAIRDLELHDLESGNHIRIGDLALDRQVG